jgi:hypothetical protein
VANKSLQQGEIGSIQPKLQLPLADARGGVQQLGICGNTSSYDTSKMTYASGALEH